MNNKEVMNISFTKFIDIDKKTAKSYDLKNGKLVKETNGNFWYGSFETIKIKPSGLENFIKSLVPGEFLIQDIHQPLLHGNCPEDTTRSKESFPFSDSPGLICIDTDSAQNFNIHLLEELNDALEKIEPSLKNILKVMSTSASSYIYIDGKEVNGLRGIHTFIPIDTTKNNKSILETLHIRSVIAGYGYAKITKAGTVKINSLIDKALCTSNQPIFEGGAIIKNAAITQKRLVETFEGSLLLANSIPPLTQEEKNRYEEMAARLNDEVSEEAEKIRQQYIKESSKKVKENNKDLTHKNAEDIINKAIDKHELENEFLILLGTDKEITVQDILDNPKEYHLKPCAHPLDNSIHGKSIIYSDQPKPIIHTFAHGGEIFYLCSNLKKKLLADWEEELNEHVQEFNKTHAQVLLGGKHKIMRSIPADIHPDSRVTYEFINLEELRKIYANEKIQVGEKFIGDINFPIMKNKITAWANHPACKTYRGGVVFAPGRKLSDEYYNTWQGFAIEPIKEADIGIIYKHIENIICANDPVLIEYFYNWMAYTMQHPDKPAGSALVLRGEKGCGKGIIGHFIRQIWGNHSIYISNAAHFVGKFNGHLADVCFLFADEAYYSGDKQNEGVLKALITDPIITIERKGVDATIQPNYLKVFMATNSEFAVPATKDERRYCVFDVANTRRGDKNYFDALTAACSDKAIQAAFLYEMLNRDIKNFNVVAIPESKGLKDQRLSSLRSPGKWLVDSLTQGYFSRQSGIISSWQNEVPCAYLYESYMFCCDSNKLTQYDRVSQNALWRYLRKLFISKKLKGDVRGYVFGSLNEAISNFEKYEKVSLEIGTETDNKQIELDEWPTISDKELEEGFDISSPSARNNDYVIGNSLQ